LGVYDINNSFYAVDDLDNGMLRVGYCWKSTEESSPIVWKVVGACKAVEIGKLDDVGKLNEVSWSISEPKKPRTAF